MPQPVDRRALLRSVGAAAAIAAAGRAGSLLANANEPVIQTLSGPVRGRVAEDVLTFTGVPYGSAKRFRAPVAAPAWRAPLDATRPPNIAPQPPALFERGAPQSEDCLQLNIWAPRETGPHPVMIFLHGGGNEGGWCGDTDFAGDTFARDGIVFVGLNYRVGALGFLELGEQLGPQYHGSGNNGLRDQLLAMHWVRANIAAFGGDPRRITLAGNSAGGKNTAAHMAMPQSRGLFSQVAMFSGGGETVHASDSARAFARLFVEKLGGKDRLHASPFGAIVDAQAEAKAAWQAGFPFRPVIDGTLLTGKPVDLIARGSADGIPLLIGTNRDESRLFVPLERAAGPLQVQDIANRSLDRMKMLDRLYSEAFPSLTTAERHWRLLTDEEYAMPCLHLAEAQAATGAAVYRYRLEYPAPGGPFKGSVPHASELPLLFDRIENGMAARFFGMSADDRPIAAALHGLIVSFVAGGAPSVEDMPSWPRFDKRERLTMMLGSSSSIAADPDRAARTIWEAADAALKSDIGGWHSSPRYRERHGR